MLPIDKRRCTAQENRAKIMDSAIKLFQQYGFESVTIDAIVKAAGFSRGTFYKLFVSKEDIVISYMAHWNQLYEEYYHQELEHSQHSAPEQIRRLAEYILEVSTRGGQAFQRIAIASGMRDALLAEKISKADAPITKILQHVLADGQAQGTITAQYSAAELTEMIYIILEGTALRWAGRYNSQSIETVSENAINMLVHMIKQ